MITISTSYASKENIPKSRYSVAPLDLGLTQDTGVILGTWAPRPTPSYLALVLLMGFVYTPTKSMK